MATSVNDLVRDLLPTAPELGLFVAPDIPEERLRGALEDYASSMQAEEVLALYDATYTGKGKDGALFGAKRMIFQNHDWSPAQDIRYEDIVQVESRKKFLGGRKVYVDVNRGRATVTAVIDFSGRPGAAKYVARFLQEAMMATMAGSEPRAGAPATDVDIVRRTLERLHDDGKLTDADLRAMLEVLRR